MSVGYLHCSPKEMIRWTPTDVEELLGARFDPESTEEELGFHKLNVEVGDLFYNLNISPGTETIWLRVDTKNTNQATPHFEFCFRCDRIRTGDGAYGSRAVFFEFSDGDDRLDLPNQTRLVMDYLPNGNLYTWPMVGAADPPFEVEEKTGGKQADADQATAAVDLKSE